MARWLLTVTLIIIIIIIIINNFLDGAQAAGHVPDGPLAANCNVDIYYYYYYY